MNKTRFRIIFNQARGMLMAVAEHIASAGKSVRASVAATSAPATRQATNTTVTLKPTHFAVLCHLGLVSFVGLSVFANLAYADIIADKSAPKNQQATVLSAPNGVPLVNIQTPSAAGVSRNTYSQFDVNTNGAILNNSRTNVQTQLGGWVQGNPSLATGNARIILNEVNSNNPSLLNGYVEVAGSHAQIVIANPAGISCNGCGFINASRATLTTGTPMLSGGDLVGYRVTGGTINFLGTGLDASQTNYTDIIARAVTIQSDGTMGAGLFSNNLNIITGANQVNVSSAQNDTDNYIGTITPITPANTASNPTPTYALDVAALGGMYASKIHMIGTEAGLGVRNAGSIGASVGEVRIDANGMLTNTFTGRITSVGNTQVTATNGVSNQGAIYAQGNTTLTTSGDLTNSGMIAALGNTSLTANGSNSHINNTATSVIAAGPNADGTLGAAGNLSLAATQSIAASGQNLSAGDQTITAQSIDLSGSQTVGRNLSFTASNGDLNAANATIAASETLAASTTQTLTTDAATVSANQLNLTAHDLSNVAGELVQTGTGDTTISLVGDLNNDQGRIATNSNNLTLAAQTLTNTSSNGTQASIEHAGTGKLDIMATTYNGTGGLIQSNGVLDFKATTATLDNGSTVAKQISMDTATLSNKNSEIIQTGTGTTAIKATTKLDNTGGVIASNGNTTLAVGDLVNQGGAIQAANTANLTVNATGAINNKALNGVVGSLQAGGAAIINAGSIDNRQGQVTAGTTLNIATTDATNGIDNNQGLIAANQTLTVSTANLGNTNGTIITTADLDLQTGALTNDAGLIQSGGNMVINTHGQALINSNSGSSKGILSQGSTTLTTGALNNQAGYIGAKGAITANSTTISNNTGAVISEVTVALNGTSLDNQTGHVEALGNIDINTTGNIDNRTGLLRSGQTLTLAAASVDNRNTQGTDATGTPTQGIEAQNVSITADQIDNSTGAMRADDMLAIIDSGTLNNSQGKLSSAGTLSITDRLANVNSNVAGKTLAITNTNGTIIANTDLNIDSNSLTGDGKVLSKGNLATKLTSDYTHSGEWQADGNATFTTTGILTNQAKLLAGKTLDLTAGTLNNQASGEIVGTTLHLAATDIHTLTNRGLIDGSDTFIDTVTLNNIGTGRIYGDHVAIAATTLTNDKETVNGITTAAVIAARDRLDIGATTITNQNGALIFSAGDMAMGGSLDSNHQATGQAGAINNVSASIEALGNLTIAATALTNKRSAFSIGRVLTGTRTTETWRCDNPGSCSYMSDLVYQWTDYQDVVTSNAPSANIRVGGNGTFTVGATTNEYSSILVGGDLSLVGSTLVNRGAELYQQSDYILTETQWHWGDRWQHTFTSGGSTSSLLGTEPAIISAGGNLTGSFTGSINNVSIRQHTALSGSGSGTQASAHTAGSVTQTAEGANSANVAVNQTSNAQIETVALAAQTDLASVARTVSPNTSLPNNNLFHTNPNPTAGYYVETDPQFASYRSWLSSDYMLSALALDPALTQKRLGDGFYEQKLIREQVAQLTGRRFLDGYSSDEAQYQAMMTNGVTFAQQYQLTPGIALSEAQVAQLTSDIVWLVQKTITLADGSTVQALVPQVYVRLQPGDLDSNGALLAGNNIDLNATGDLNNNSSIAGRNIVKLTADNINNLGGRIQAGNQLSLDAKNDLNVIGTTSHVDIRQRNSNNAVQQTKVNRVAGLYVTNPNGVLVASAGRDINLKAAEIINSSTSSEQAGTHGTTIIDAGNNLNLGTITETGSTYGQGRGGGKKGYRRENTTQEVGTVIQTDGDLSLSAGQDITARAANVTSSNGALNVAAGNDITIEAGIATYDMEAYRKGKKSGTFSSKTSTTRDTVNDSKVISSTFSGESVSMAAGNNLTVKGSNVVGTNEVNLNAGNNVTLTTEQATHDETHYSKTKKSGFTASSTSIGYGSSKLTNTNDSQQVTNVGSTVGSVEGNVNINSGKTYNQTGSDVLTPKGDINIAAQQVNITNATDTYANQQTMKYKQTGLTLAITSPVISAIQTAQQMSKAASNTDDTRMQALAAGTAALSASNAADAVIAGNTPKLDENGLQVLDANGNNTAENPANQVGGVNVSLSIGTSKSSSKTTQTNSSAKSSTLNAGGDINITAVRPELVEGQTSEASNINVIGSTIKAANDVTLKADDQINLQAAQNVDTLNSKNKGSSASLGVSIGTDGFLVTAGLSGSKGKTNGNGTSWTETQIQSGNSTGDIVTLESSTDTNIKGAQVIGNQVVANVGTSGSGNLNIESLQDTNQYKDKQQSIGGSISIGYGKMGGSFNYSDSKTKSNYASVNEQSGIMAGDGGFQVDVNGNTNLTRAVIASTDKAIQDNKNSLTTETLTTSNIENKTEYKANAMSVSVGGGTQSGKPALTGAGIGSDSGDAKSVTVSGISQGTVIITDSDEQQALTGQDATTTVALLNRDVKVNENGEVVDSAGNSTANTIAPIFDAEKVQKEIQAQVQITQAFGQQASTAVENYVQTQRKALQQQLKNSETETDKAAIQAQLSDLTTQERVMNVLIGAVTGMGDTALTKETLSVAADEMRQITIENSKLFAGVTDGTTTLDNISGESEGVRGDGIKAGGTRVDLDLLCGEGNSRCATNDDGSLQLNDKGQVKFKGSLAEFLETDEGKQSYGATGGIQGWKGTLFGTPYTVGSWQDKLIEAFGGTHDVIGGQISGLYDELGNITQGMTGAERTAYDTWAAIAIVPAAPFAAAELLPPEVWQAISVLLRNAK